MSTDKYHGVDPSQEPAFQLLEPWRPPHIEPAHLDPLLARGDMMILAGAPGTAKTSLAVSIALGIAVPELASRALGGAVVPMPDPNRGAVGILDAENSRARLESQVRRYLQSAGIERDEYSGRIFRYEAEALKIGMPAFDREFSRRGIKEIARQGVEVLVVDTVITALRPEDPSSSRWVTERLVELRSACQGACISLIVLAHTAKRQSSDTGPISAYGTTMQEALADTVVYVTGLKSDAIKLTLRKCRRAEWIRQGSVVTIELLGDGHFRAVDPRNTWPLAPDDTPRDPLTPRRRQAYAFVCNGATDGVTTTDLAAALDIKPSTALDHLSDLKQLGLVRLVGSARNARWVASGEEARKP